MAKESVVKDVRKVQQAWVVELAGEVDLHRSVEVRAALLEVMNKRPVAVVINLTEVSFMDSSGLATLVEALQLARRQGGQLKLVGATRRVKSILEISRLESLFEMHASEEEALQE